MYLANKFIKVFRYRICILFIILLIKSNAFSQSFEFKLYSKSLRQIEEKNYKGALKTIKYYLKFYPTSPRLVDVYCNKALIHTELKLVNEAMDDYYTAMALDSFNVDVYKMRGKLYYKNKNSIAALKDYNRALRLDSAQAECYYLKAGIYKEEGSDSIACLLYNKALQYGYKDAFKKITELCDTNTLALSRYLLKILDLRSLDSDYGYSEFKPIKIGGNSHERLEQYLSMLRDKNGYPVVFKHMNSCCPYKSSNGNFGKALCDTYEVIINDDKRILFLSLYDYEEPKIPVGLYSTYHFKE